MAQVPLIVTSGSPVDDLWTPCHVQSVRGNRGGSLKTLPLMRLMLRVGVQESEFGGRRISKVTTHVKRFRPTEKVQW